jgi:prevent-host-death family protein
MRQTSHGCYDRRMTDVAVRDLRNNTRQVIERVNAGETITITVDGRPAAELRPVGTRPRFTDRQTFASSILSQQADPGLRHDLTELAPDTTDDLKW